MNKKNVSWKKFIPILLILAFMALAYAMGITDYLTFDQLKEHRHKLKAFVSDHPVLAPVGFMLLYAASTALSVPGGIFLTIFGGFLFPQPFATLYVLLGATTGALAIFLAAKTALREVFQKKAGSTLEKMRAGFQENAVNYMLFLRLVPLFPFWLVNIAPAFFNVPLSSYAWTTFVGILPGVFVFTQAGASLDSILESADGFSLDAIFTWDVRIALIALGIFAILPVLIKKFWRKKT